MENRKYIVNPFLLLPDSFLMAEVCRICIKYPNLPELSLLEHPLVGLVIAKSLSASIVGPKASHYNHQILIR